MSLNGLQKDGKNTEKEIAPKHKEKVTKSEFMTTELGKLTVLAGAVGGFSILIGYMKPSGFVGALLYFLNALFCLSLIIKIAENKDAIVKQNALKKVEDNGKVTPKKIKLLKELGVKYKKEDLVAIYVDTESGMVAWLGKGNENNGLNHIKIRYAQQLQEQLGITGDDAIINYIGQLLKRSTKYELITEKILCNIYEVAKGKFCILEYEGNGSIVSLYCTSDQYVVLSKVNNATKILKQ